MQYCLLLKAKARGRKDILMVYSWMYSTRKEAVLAAKKRNTELRRVYGIDYVFVTPRVLFEE